jgi:hypothetical protein
VGKVHLSMKTGSNNASQSTGDVVGGGG